jgi:hypothetical protein
MLLPAYPLEYRKPRGRGKSPAQSSAPASPVTVVAVQLIDSQHVWWKFSAPVVSAGDVSGLLMNGQLPDGVDEISAEGWLKIFYDIEIVEGDAWMANDPAVIVFDGGGELDVPESGGVVP